MSDEDARWRQCFTNYRKAVFQLKEFLEQDELNKFETQGLIQCFEYTFELAWKTAKDYLEAQGFLISSPRQAIQTAFQAGLITDGHGWIDALEKRNLMSNTYDENRTKEAAGLIRQKYAFLLQSLLQELEKLQ